MKTRFTGVNSTYETELKEVCKGNAIHLNEWHCKEAIF